MRWICDVIVLDLVLVLRSKVPYLYFPLVNFFHILPHGNSIVRHFEFVESRLIRQCFQYNFCEYGLLTKCEVKMAGYWPSSFFVCLWTETKSRSIKRGQYQAILTEQTWSIKDLWYGFWRNFAYGIQQVVPSGQDGSILPTQVANHSARFRSSCSLAELPI